MLSTYLLLQADPSGGMSSLIMFGIMILIFWFFIIRPQSKQQREQRQFMADLKKGDEVVTSSGIIGRINKIEGEVVTLEVDKQVYMRFTKGAVSKQMTDALEKAGQGDKSSEGSKAASQDK
jgi:preprotein translocase subunit YajC